MWKSSEDVEDKWEVQKTCRSEWKTGEGPEEVGKVVEECGRDGKARECNATLQVEDIHIILMLCSV